MAARLFRSGLTLLAAFVVVWIAVIVWWQTTNRMPSTADIVTYLFLLPLGMVIGYWVIKRALDGIRTNVAAGRELSAAAPAAAAKSDGTPADPQDATRHWRAVLLASALRAPGGSDAASLVDAVQASTQPGLTDVQGFGQPIFAAPVDGLDIEDLRTELTERHPDVDWLDEHLRALTLAGQVAEELAAHAVAQHPEPAGPDATRLVITALLPREWTPQQQAAADAWLRQRIGVIWRADHLTLEPITAKGDADALLLLDRATQAVNRTSDERVLRMLVVADSLVGPSAVEQLTQNEQLFEANRQHGRVPGEAAAGVLLCAPALAVASVTPSVDDTGDDAPPAAITITRASVARLEAPTPDRGQPQLEALGGAVRHVLETLAAAPAGANGKAPAAAEEEPLVASVVTDTGMHPVRTVEVARIFSERFPTLDVAADLLPLGTPCGYVGAAGSLLPVVVAHQLSQQSGKPVLAITANDIQQRGAIAVVPSLT
ncbi:hypothetical protein [Ralstonia flaminis]|jgi:hypothetical protein|uniref:Transmembrane protein n=1 Tax=Ralstonia flaminis TaxID=3058597 RepID=A0ABM9KC37_9RALS|nr:hypothetical protein [Ralstonia sp. LMG 18101]CAJ0820958.1 hypothetical protein LMG18101_04462 [Ralstonia sp. LMG 18101]